MALKRKRSESELSLSSSTSSLFSSPTRPESTGGDSYFPPRPLALMRASAPSHLHSRTLKRFRDNRPSQEEVHQHTMDILYSAQQQQSNLLFPASTRFQPVLNALHSPAAAPVQTQQQPTSQRSLHCFWNIPSAPIAAPSAPLMDHPVEGPTSCEDCGAGFNADGGVDSMEVDGYASDGHHACLGCGKHVCSHCSVSNLGEQRRCLQCAGRKGWVGGGWTQLSFPLC